MIDHKINMEEVCGEAVRHFGAESQTMMAIEEMAELTKELCKHHRGKQNFYDIAEEIADVQIMLEQMIVLHDCRNAVGDWTFVKLMRLKEMMSNDANS